jgi:hypothetical protein
MAPRGRAREGKLCGHSHTDLTTDYLPGFDYASRPLEGLSEHGNAYPSVIDAYELRRAGNGPEVGTLSTPFAWCLWTAPLAVSAPAGAGADHGQRRPPKYGHCPGSRLKQLPLF